MRITRLAIVFLLTILTFVTYARLRIYRIPSRSMESTIKKGDFVWAKSVDKENLNRGDILIFYRIEDFKRRTYIKRCCALPGDTLFINNNDVFINSRKECLYFTICHTYKVSLNADSCIGDVMSLFEKSNCDFWLDARSGDYMVTIPIHKLNDLQYQIAKFGSIQEEYVHRYDEKLLPRDTIEESTIQSTGPIIVPKKGDTLSITGVNIFWYKSVLEIEGTNFELENNSVYLDGNLREYYITKQDYIFLLGDNRNESYDSRDFGFIPISHVDAKTSRICFSYRKINGSNTKKVDLSRFLKKIN